jgi:hypothetical protein
LVIDDLCILGVPVGSHDFITFLDEALSQNMAHIDDLPFLVDTQVTLGIFFLICRLSTFLSQLDNTSSFFLSISFGEFQ